MKKLILVLTLGGMGAHAGPTVTICMANFPGANAVVTVATAQATATRMFAAIDVPVEWHGHGSCPNGRLETIRISLTVGTPHDYLPGALAYAQPFDGTHVRVFYDRVQSAGDSGAVPLSTVLANVLVHEITHILQGTARHSPSGVMMAKWGPAEYHQMARSPLAFTQEDVLTIHNGLLSRSSAARAPVGIVP